MKTRKTLPSFLGALFASALALTVAGCGGSSGGGPPPGSGGPDVTIGNACDAPDAGTALSPAAIPDGGAAIAIERVFPGLAFDQPLLLQQEPEDSRCWYVVERAGRVLAFENSPTAAEASLFIDLTAAVDSEAVEAGLLGMAFHPDYSRNGEVFLSFTRDDGGLTSYVSRFRTLDDGRSLDPDSEQVLLSLAQPFRNHNGGNIAFGPDGYLYVGFGDGGASNDPGQRSQDLMNLFGSLLRIDVSSADYSIPADNPFAGNERCTNGFGAAPCPEIFAWGLRNPWRWSFDRETGELWLGDVGEGAREEINLIERGGNYGWPFFEGTRCNTEAPVIDCDFDYVAPLTEYDRDSGRSVTGGYVYRGSAIPDLRGGYVYADFVSGNLFQFESAGVRTVQALQPTGLRVSTFGEDRAGELYLLDYAGGSIHKIVPAP